MRMLRRLSVAASLSILGAGGLALVSAGPVAAVSGAASTLECTPGTTGSGQTTMTCLATAKAGIHFVKVIDVTFAHQFTASSRLDCGEGATTDTITFPAFFNDRYKVVVADCQQPKNAKDIYRVGPDGTVALVSSAGGGSV